MPGTCCLFWAISHPEIFGEQLLVITSEFDRFDRSDRRLDIRALDEDGSGWVMKSPEAALWAFHAADSFAEAVLRAVNLGLDEFRARPTDGPALPAGVDSGMAGTLPVAWSSVVFGEGGGGALASRRPATRAR